MIEVSCGGNIGLVCYSSNSVMHDYGNYGVIPTADRYGDHQILCGGNSDRIHWHNSGRDGVFSAAHSAALAT